MMIRYLVYSIFAIVFFSSCGDVKDEMWIEQDGSGKMHYTMDLSNSIAMIQMMGSMSEDTLGGGDMDMMGSFFEEMGGENVDTTMNFADFGDEVNIDDPQKAKLMRNISLNLKADKEEGSAMMKMMINFDSFGQLKEMFDLLGEADMEETPGGAPNIGELFGGTNLGADYSFDKKKFFRAGGEMGGMGDMMGEEGGSDEDMAMLQMMFGGATISSEYHFPYKVKSVSDPNAVVKGNTVFIEQDMMDLMKSEKVDDLEIKFKKKFLGIF